MRVCLFEDARVADLEPLCLVRPVFDLLSGCTTLGDKQLRHLVASGHGVLVRPELAEVVQERAPRLPVNDHRWLTAGPVVLVNGRWLPSSGSLPSAIPGVGICDDEVAYAVLTPDLLRDCTPETLDDCLDAWRHALPTHPAGGRMVRYLWDLVDANGDEIARDVAAGERPWRTTDLPAVVGPSERLYVDPMARVDPYVVADTTGGPVVLDRDVTVTAFTRLEGPCYVGPGSQVLGAKVRGGTSIGPNCRVGGEVECSVLLGHANKYHDGFLGHAYVGEWVNLGAGTSNSDLRNDYGEVSVVLGGRRLDTGRTKVGCFLGDHTKAGLGTLLNTGTVAGVFSHLLPTGGLLPKYVPAFASVWDGALRDNADLETLLQSARTVMARRGRTLSAAQERLYRLVWARTAGERRQALQEAEMRRLRRGA